MDRFRYEDILRRVQAKIVERFGPLEDREHKKLYEDERIAITKDQWNRKFKGDVRFSFPELSRLAAYFGAPPHWPLIPWDEAVKLQPKEPGPPPDPEAAASSGLPERRKGRGQ